MDLLKDIRRWSPYELKAVEAIRAATADYCAVAGTDLAKMDEETRDGLWVCAIRAHQDGIRRALKEAPF